jgi:hypothetical protein
MLQDSISHPVDNVKPKRDIVEQVADMTLHQLSIALSQKKSRKSEARCVALLGFYSLSMNNMGSKSSVLLLSPKLSKKGKGRASVGTICFLLSIASTKYINGNKNGNQGTNRRIESNCLHNISEYQMNYSDNYSCDRLIDCTYLPVAVLFDVNIAVAVGAAVLVQTVIVLH